MNAHTDQRWDGHPARATDEMKTRLKITEPLRAARLRRIEGELVPSVTHDTEVPGFALHVTTQGVLGRHLPASRN
jgi:hypothetical protein